MVCRLSNLTAAMLAATLVLISSASSFAENTKPIVIDCRGDVTTNPGVAGDPALSGFGTGVSGISDSGILIGCDKVYRCLDKIPAGKAAHNFSWYFAAIKHKREYAANTKQKCLMILMPADWDKLQKLSGLKIPLGK